MYKSKTFHLLLCVSRRQINHWKRERILPPPLKYLHFLKNLSIERGRTGSRNELGEFEESAGFVKNVSRPVGEESAARSYPRDSQQEHHFVFLVFPLQIQATRPCNSLAPIMGGRAFARGSLRPARNQPLWSARTTLRGDNGSPISNATSALENAICRSTCPHSASTNGHAFLVPLRGRFEESGR